MMFRHFQAFYVGFDQAVEIKIQPAQTKNLNSEVLDNYCLKMRFLHSQDSASFFAQMRFEPIDRYSTKVPVKISPDKFV